MLIRPVTLRRFGQEMATHVKQHDQGAWPDMSIDDKLIIALKGFHGLQGLRIEVPRGRTGKIAETL